MATLFGTLTAIVMALSIWMGYKNYTEYEEQIKFRQAEERTTKQRQDRLAQKKEELAGVIAEKEDLIAQQKVKQEELDSLNAEVEKMERDIDSKKDLIARNQQKIDTSEAKMKELPDPDVLLPQITSTQKKIAQLKADIESDKGKLADLTDTHISNTQTVASKREVISYQISGKSLPTLSTTVNGVYRNWGFVTLNGGNAQGVVPGSVLDVLRNGEVIAKLKVTAVEQNRAAADIIPDALPVNVSPRSGDRVVAEKVEEAPAQ